MKVLKNDVTPNTEKLVENNNNSQNLKIENLSTQPSMISFAMDLPNICTLFGLLSAFSGIYFAIHGNFYFAVIGGAWAVLFDWLDGLIASIGFFKRYSKFWGFTCHNPIELYRLQYLVHTSWIRPYCWLCYSIKLF